MNEENKKILILEDEKPLANALSIKLSHENFFVKVLSNGEGAVSLIEKEKFDLLITDLVMPKVDGFEVIKEIKEKNINIPIIVLTNLGQTEDQKKVKELGVDNFFVKSDTPLLKIIEFVKNNIK